MTHVTCRLTAKNRDQLRNPTLGNRVWTTFTFLIQDTQYSAPGRTAQYCDEPVCLSADTSHEPHVHTLTVITYHWKCSYKTYKLRWLWRVHVCYIYIYLRPLLRSSLANCDMLSATVSFVRIRPGNAIQLIQAIQVRRILIMTHQTAAQEWVRRPASTSALLFCASNIFVAHEIKIR